MDNSQFIIPMGNSGNLLDNRYDNMLESFLAGEYPFFHYSPPLSFSHALCKQLLLRKILPHENEQLSCCRYFETTVTYFKIEFTTI
jgi:hypothetical protein